jgi:4-hydroxy-4-methyl-2-oxoglutarate aldolase
LADRLSFEALVERVRPLPAATIYEAAGRTGDMEPAIRSIVDGARLFGPALTVSGFIGQLAAARAIELATRGQVMVVDCGGTERATAWGGTFTKAAIHRGLAGLVTNGCVRDVDEIRRAAFPTFATGVSVRGGLLTEPGRYNGPISVGGVVVNPGDWIVGDADGVVVIPAQDAEAIFTRALERAEYERAIDARVEAGEPLSAILGNASK